MLCWRRMTLMERMSSFSVFEKKNGKVCWWEENIFEPSVGLLIVVRLNKTATFSSLQSGKKQFRWLYVSIPGKKTTKIEVTQSELPITVKIVLVFFFVQLKVFLFVRLSSNHHDWTSIMLEEPRGRERKKRIVVDNAEFEYERRRN